MFTDNVVKIATIGYAWWVGSFQCAIIACV
jgi:hypothetical protein